MRQKLQIERKASGLEAFQNARRSPVPWLSGHKLSVLEGLLLNEDAGGNRKTYAAENNISPRTLQRWIHQLNTGGLSSALEPVRHDPGQKRKVSLQEFRERILPTVQHSLRQTGRPDTVTNLYQAAQDLGLLDVSYATFRRRLRLTTNRFEQ